MNQAGVLANTARTFADRPAVAVGREVRLNYGELAMRAGRLASTLTGRFGLRPGERVAIAMKNCAEYFEVWYGIWWAGLCAVPINAKLHQREFAYIIENSGARLCFATPDLAGPIAELRHEIDTLAAVVSTDTPDYAACFSGDPAPLTVGEPDHLAWLFYTSGTTGRPKGAMLTNRNLLANVMNYFADVDTITPADCMIHCAPLSHGSGCYALPHVAKAACNVLPESGAYNPAETLDLIAAWPNCSFFFAPTMVTLLVNADPDGKADTSNLKAIIYGGGPMYVEDVLKALDRFGPKLVQIYGQGEAPMTITGLSKAMHADATHPRYLERLGSTGIARTDVQVRVVDADDRELPAGEMGEVVCRGDVVMAGYWSNPQATADALRGGWLHTGDVGVFDADGFLTLKDRSKDMIISGGTNIYPREIEEVLLRHAGVLECSVVGRPHADWGEEVVAFVVARDGTELTVDELDRLCLDNIARFKRPKDYRVVDALPKNNYGKVLKTELRQWLENKQA